MGLDMSIYRISKSYMDDSVIYNREDITGVGVILSESDMEEPMYQQLAPYTQPVQIKTKYYDMEKIRKDYNMSSNSYISMMSGDHISITERETRKTVKISSQDIMRKYIIERVENCFVCKLNEVQYWRKAYDIQDWFHDHIDGDVENTGYYILSKELLLEFNKAFPREEIEAEEPDEESALFYWEWY